MTEGVAPDLVPAIVKRNEILGAVVADAILGTTAERAAGVVRPARSVALEDIGADRGSRSREIVEGEGNDRPGKRKGHRLRGDRIARKFQSSAPQPVSEAGHSVAYSTKVLRGRGRPVPAAATGNAQLCDNAFGDVEIMLTAIFQFAGSGEHRCSGNAEVMKISIHRRLEELADTWPRHGGHMEGRCYAFQSADLVAVWCDTVGEARKIAPYFVSVREDDGTPSMLLPLGIERRRGIRLLSFLDASIADYNIPVLFPRVGDWSTEQVRTVWASILKALPSVDVVLLDKMPESVDGRPNPLIALGAAPIGVSGHAATLSGTTWTAFEETRLPRRRTLRRHRRKLEDFGAVRFEIPGTAERREAVLEAMTRQKERRFAETGATGFRSPGKMAFFQEAGRRLSGGTVHLSALVVGDAIVATHLGYVFDQRFYQIMPTYETGHWQALSVGRLLHEDLIRWSFEHGIRVFDFGVGDEAYKFEYCDEVLPLHGVVYATSITGRLYLAAQAGQERLRQTRMWEHLRALKHGRSASPAPSNEDP